VPQPLSSHVSHREETYVMGDGDRSKLLSDVMGDGDSDGDRSKLLNFFKKRIQLSFPH